MESDPKRNVFVLTGYHGVYGQRGGRGSFPTPRRPWFATVKAVLNKTILSEYLIFLRRKDRDGVKIR